MAYCPKCGVEVDDHVLKCPLCNFPIPDISEEGQCKISVEKFPEASNIYDVYRSKIKNQVYFVSLIVLVTILVVLAAVRVIYPVRHDVIQYIFIATISLVMFLFFTYGFFGWTVNITGLGMSLIYLTYYIARVGEQGWFMPYALPIVLIVYVNGLAFHYMFKHSKKRQRLSYIPAFVLMIGSSLCIGVDCVISYNVMGSVKPTWSLIVALSGMSIAFLMHVVFNYLPETVKEKLQRKFHM